MIGDLRVVGPQADLPRRLASGGTAVSAGEPLNSQATSSSGVANSNVYALTAADGPIVGTDRFGGIALKNSLNAAAGTTNAQELPAACPVPSIGRIIGKAETAGNIDTEAEIIAIIGDFVLINYDATGASDGGELYTIHDDASADTSGLEIVKGDPAIGELEVTVASTVYRFDVS